MLKAMKFSELTQALSARVLSSDCSFDGVSIDSRAIKPGQLFVALYLVSVLPFGFFTTVKVKLAPSYGYLEVLQNTLPIVVKLPTTPQRRLGSDLPVLLQSYYSLSPASLLPHSLSSTYQAHGN